MEELPQDTIDSIVRTSHWMVKRQGIGQDNSHYNTEVKRQIETRTSRALDYQRVMGVSVV